MKLSENFTTEEATRSNKAVQLHIDNSMDTITRLNAEWFAKNVLQHLRDKIGKPFIISSWYRCPALNKAVGGKSTSAHLYGMAVDFLIEGMDYMETYKRVLVALKDMRISFDQLICEKNTKTGARWVHLGVKKTGNRQQSFTLNV